MSLNPMSPNEWNTILLTECSDVTEKKNDLVNRAKLSEQAERYEDMVKIMKEVAELKVSLTAEVSCELLP